MADERSMALSLTEQLAGICSRPVAPATRCRAARHVLDWLGCALVGSTEPAGRALSAYGKAYSAALGNCFTVGAAPRGAMDAAFINGGLGNILEMDDLHRASILHAGDVVVPAALAVAQEHGSCGNAFLDAIVGGYENAIRIGTAAAASGYSAWYNSGTCGVFGATFAAGSIMGLSEDQMSDAWGQAGMLASGIWQCRLEPTHSKQLAAAQAAQSGVLAARLAATGFPGARKILEGELGFFNTYYPAADASRVLAEPEANWKIEDVSFKPWSACRHTHPAIEAALNFRAECPAGDIEQAMIYTYAAAIDFCDNARPASDHEARFSLQHCVAVTLLRGDPQLSDFSAYARHDPAVAALTKRITIAHDEELTRRFPGMMGSRIEIKLRDGTKRDCAVATAKGDPENPMSDEELDAKFLKLAGAAGINEDVAKDVSEQILSFHEHSNLDRLNQSLAKLTTEPK